MNAEELSIVSIDTTIEGDLIEAELQIGPKNHHIYFRSDNAILTENTEAFLAFALLPCMKKGGALVANGRVSQRFLEAIRTILDIYCAWDTSLHRVEIKNVIPVVRDQAKGNRIGVFFSGGVDSFYTFLKHRDEITDLIFVHGFDKVLDEDPSLRRRMSETLYKISSRFGKRVIEIETNLRSFLDPYVPWATLAHGAALAGIGHLLFPFFSRIYIAATHTYADLFLWGSHPLLDPLWSTETLEFIHDGCEATRIDKVGLLSEFDVALQSLLVCWEHHNGAFNCGQCEKCLRTMINLYVVGALDRCTTFDTALDIKRVSKLIVRDQNTRAFVEENLKALESRQGDQALYNALHKVLNRPRWQIRIIKMRKKMERKYHHLIK